MDTRRRRDAEGSRCIVQGKELEENFRLLWDEKDRGPVPSALAERPEPVRREREGLVDPGGGSQAANACAKVWEDKVVLHWKIFARSDWKAVP